MRLLRLVCLLAALAAASCGSGKKIQAITGAMLIDGTSRPPLEQAVVLIEDDRIKSMGTQQSVKIPPQAVRFEAGGKFVFPLDAAQPMKTGGPADLLILDVNPALDPDYQKRSVGKMQGGRWMQYPIGLDSRGPGQGR